MNLARKLATGAIAAGLTTAGVLGATPASATVVNSASCGAYQVGPTQSVTDGGIVFANVQMWYNACDSNNRFVYGTMTWNSNNPETNVQMNLTVGVEDQTGAFPFGKATASAWTGYGAGCVSSNGCQAIAHGVNIDAYGAPKQFRVWASLQMNPSCATPIATTWWQYSYGKTLNDGVSAQAC